MDIQEIFLRIEERKQELFELLSSLVKVNSESFGTRGNEKALAEQIHRMCLDLGLESACYSPAALDHFADHPDYVPGRGLEERRNVTAVWRGAENRNALMIMAHTDTVQIGDPENWELAPLSGEIRSGRIYGRGAGDDKSGIAVMLFLTKLLKEAGFVPRQNLLLSAYCDEEYGGSHGALAAVLRDPSACYVNLDACEKQIAHCATGGGEMIYRFHSEKPVDSAGTVARALTVVMDEIDLFGKRRREELEANRFYIGTIIPETSLRYIGIKAGENGQDLGVGQVHFVFYTDRTKEEIHAELTAMQERLRTRLIPMGMIGDGFRPATRFFHYVWCEPDCHEILEMKEAAYLATGCRPTVCGAALSDQSVIAKYGGGIAFSMGAIRSFEKEGGAHQPNEYVECDRLVELAKTVAAYILLTLDK